MPKNTAEIGQGTLGKEQEVRAASPSEECAAQDPLPQPSPGDVPFGGAPLEFELKRKAAESSVPLPETGWTQAEIRDAASSEIELERKEIWKRTLEQYADRLDGDPDAPPRAQELFSTVPETEHTVDAPYSRIMANLASLGDLGDAQMLQEQSGHEFCYDNTAQRWFRFNGVIWKRDGNRQVRREVSRLAEFYDKAAFQQKRKIREAERGEVTEAKGVLRSIRSRSKALRGYSIDRVLDEAASGDNSMGIAGNEWDQHPELLACANGVIDLESGKLHRGDPKLYLRMASPYEYHGLHAEAEPFDEMLDMVFCGNAELRDYFERVVGCAATGLREKKIWCAYGPKGDNGKSILFETLAGVLGDFAGNLKVDLLLDQRKQQNEEPYLIALKGRRMAVASEPPKNSYFSLERVKMLTGSDTVTARGLYMPDPLEFKPVCKIFVHTNFVPRLKNADQAFLKRLVIVPFHASFVAPEAADPSRHMYPRKPEDKIKELFRQHGPGILSWVVRCARRYLRNRDLSEPECVRKAGSSYEQEYDTLGDFIRSCCELADSEIKTRAKVLYDVFALWQELEKGIPPERIIKSRSFNADMRQRFDDHDSNVLYFKGICLKPEYKGSIAELRERWPKKADG